MSQTSLSLSCIPCPAQWGIGKVYVDDDLSSLGQLRCLGAKLMTNKEQTFIITLDIESYLSSELSDPLLKVALDGKETEVVLHVADLQGFRVSLWGILPPEFLQNGLQLMLQVTAADRHACDALPVGKVIMDETCVDRLPFDNELSPMLESPQTSQASFSNAPENVPDAEPWDKEFLGLSERLPTGYKRMELVILSDFGSTLESWSKKEKAIGRRLVRFERRQAGPVVRLTFETQPPQESYEDTERIISCISWPQGRVGYFLTSFDVLKLAEYILGTSMNTEVKNRARRNMAAVASKTLAKGDYELDTSLDADNEAFLKVMSFDDPKPRSIEKSIKIYDWFDLKHCLEKILSRFVIFQVDDPKQSNPFEHQLDAEKRWKRMMRGTKKAKTNVQGRQPKTSAAKPSRQRASDSVVLTPGSDTSVDRLVKHTTSSSNEEPFRQNSPFTATLGHPALSRPASSSSVAINPNGSHISPQIQGVAAQGVDSSALQRRTIEPASSLQSGPHSPHFSLALYTREATPAMPSRHARATSQIHTPALLASSGAQALDPNENPMFLENNWQHSSLQCHEISSTAQLSGQTNYPVRAPFSLLTSEADDSIQRSDKRTEFLVSPFFSHQPLELDSPADRDPLFPPSETGSGGCQAPSSMEDDELDEWIDYDYFEQQQGEAEERSAPLFGD